MSIFRELSAIWQLQSKAILISNGQEIFFEDICAVDTSILTKVKAGDVVALIGDFEPVSIAFLLTLIDIGAIIVPLTEATENSHEVCCKVACVDFVIRDGELFKHNNKLKNNTLESFRRRNSAGLIAFSSGTTGEPKAFLHDFSVFLSKFKEPKKILNTVNFLLFDHVGGLNTFFYSLFNCGTSIIPNSRTVEEVMLLCDTYRVELLPATPTFLRMLLFSNFVPKRIPKTLKIISYGTEIMDVATLNNLCELLPNVDFRQTYGVSELGVLNIRSERRNSVYFSIGGKGVSTRIKENVLQIKTSTRMFGYLNAPDPFSDDGWYNTGDIVTTKGRYIRIVGRSGDLINVSGLKFVASEVEQVLMRHKDVVFAKVYPKNNPITGQHCEVMVQPFDETKFDFQNFKLHNSESSKTHASQESFTEKKFDW